ncbi:hypothetical protein [Chryseobacterium sp. JM1]|uniref:hypothetical protein n=1 Tax=Chryseobacterium sp. JM1 TaxID=1233950 RepID=UPI0004E7221D|nr:hypothetical protein [Chryseobacterium sp. JM1]KFF21563.1 hypothetical protein IW22_06285 [Chryseobacterium sp. JM1]
MEDLKKKILDDIELTGFVSELQVNSLLIKKGWSTRHSETYEDKDYNKSREIDIIATKTYYDEESKLHVEFQLVIDVKRMKKRPWVVFSVEKRNNTSQGWRILSTGHNNTTNNGGKFKSGLFTKGEVDTNNFKKNIKNYGIAFHESFKPPNEISKVYESLIGVCKAAWHKKEKYSYDKKFEEFDLKEETEIYIFIPVVVLDGNLFEVKLDEKGEIELNEKELIQVQLSYSSPNYSTSDLIFFPDIVTTDKLADYLEKSEKWFKGMTKEFKNTILKKYRN